MRGMSKRAAGVEMLILLMLIIYLVLQLIYGISYHVAPIEVGGNMLAAILVYGVQTYLYTCPWKINGLKEEQCKATVRTYSRHMIQALKLLFHGGLLIPCFFDFRGIELKEGYSAIFIFLLLFVTIGYEIKIVKEMRK